ncbi:MAG: thiamine phosphate synthase [Hyphomonas sp.]
MSVEPQSRRQRKLIAAARTAAAHLPPALPPALFLTDPARTPDPAGIANGLPAGFGVIYRHFGVPDRSEAAHLLAQICRRRGLCLLIAGDPHLACAVDADGVHWPFRMRQAARKWQGRFALQTMSAHSPRELRIAEGFPVDGVVLSTAFASASPSAGRPLGAIRFHRLAREAGSPVYALGGITAETAGIAAKVAGFAAVNGMRPFGPAIRT